MAQSRKDVGVNHPGRLPLGIVALSMAAAVGLLWQTNGSSSNAWAADQRAAKDAATWKEAFSEKELEGAVKLYADELKTKVLKTKGQFSSGYKKAMQAGHVFAILGNAGTVMLEGDAAKTAAALREAGVAFAAASKSKKYDEAKAAFAKIDGYPKKTEPAASGDTAKWTEVTNIEVIMENVSRIDSDVQKAIKSSSDFGKMSKELATRTKMLAALATVARETKSEEAWQKFCDEMFESSLALSKQFASKNQSGAKTANDAVQKSCKQCHDKYNVVE
jgi:hypothetical protein